MKLREILWRVVLFFAFPGKLKKDVFAPFWLNGTQLNYRRFNSRYNSILVTMFTFILETARQAIDENTPALEVVLMYKDNIGKYYSKREAYDPNSSRRSIIILPRQKLTIILVMPLKLNFLLRL